jgi:hypothetical protein
MSSPNELTFGNPVAAIHGETRGARQVERSEALRLPAWQRFLRQARPVRQRPSVDLGWLGRVVSILRPETFEGLGRSSFFVDAVIKRLVGVLDSPGIGPSRGVIDRLWNSGAARRRRGVPAAARRSSSSPSRHCSIARRTARGVVIGMDRPNRSAAPPSKLGRARSFSPPASHCSATASGSAPRRSSSAASRRRLVRMPQGESARRHPGMPRVWREPNARWSSFGRQRVQRPCDDGRYGALRARALRRPRGMAV